MPDNNRENELKQPFVRVLGSADWHPTQDNDGSCYTVNDRCLVDTGYFSLGTLLHLGIDPTSLNTIFFTHMHSDHCVGLAPLLQYWRVVKSDMSDLTIVGPRDTVRGVVETAMRCAMGAPEQMMKKIKTRPTIVEFSPGETIRAGGCLVQACASQHAVPGLCYRFTREDTGKSICFTGDTRYHPGLPAFFQGCELLLHEASFGEGPLDEERNAVCRHSSAQEAVRVCREGNVKHLVLTHCYEPKREAALAYARAALSIPVDWATPYRVFTA